MNAIHRDRSPDAASLPAYGAPPSPSSAAESPLGGNLDELDDQVLLRRCRAGDEAAWRLLVDRYSRLVFSVALRNGLSREDAADVTQTTFVALLDSIDQIRGTDRLASWLMTVARRQAWRLRRRLDAQAAALPPALEEVDSAQQWEQLEWLHSGLARLPNPCRELLQALYFDASEPSYAQVAARLGRAVGSLGSMRARCLARLRIILRDDDGEGRSRADR